MAKGGKPKRNRANQNRKDKKSNSRKEGQIPLSKGKETLPIPDTTYVSPEKALFRARKFSSPICLSKEGLNNARVCDLKQQTFDLKKETPPALPTKPGALHNKEMSSPGTKQPAEESPDHVQNKETVLQNPLKRASPPSRTESVVKQLRIGYSPTWVKDQTSYQESAGCFGRGQFAAGNKLDIHSWNEKVSKLQKEIQLRNDCELEVQTAHADYAKAQVDLQEAITNYKDLYNRRVSQFWSFSSVAQEHFGGVNLDSTRHDNLSKEFYGALELINRCAMAERAIYESCLALKMKLDQVNKRLTDADHDMRQYPLKQQESQGITPQ